MTWHQAFTGGVVGLLIAALVSRRMSPDISFLCALALLLVSGVLTAAEAVAGFANPAVITVGLLYIVAIGLKETGGMITLTRRWLGRPGTLLAAKVRLLVPVAALSAFVNNTPVVAMFLPVLSQWAKRNRLHASQLFMPLSYAAMLGGMCTLIGTSTNLVVYELLVEHQADAAAADPAAPALPATEPFGMFTLAWLGVPITLVGLVYILVLGRRILPARTEDPLIEDPRDYTVWMRIASGSPVAGRTIERADLRHLSGLYLAEIERDDELIIAPGPDQVLREGDRLKFVGLVESVVELQQIQGLTPDTEQIDKLDEPRQRRQLIEAVVSPASGLVGKSVREGEFRTRYNAVIIAVHRAGERIRKKIGDIVLQPGDTLLLEAPPGFARQHRNSSAFYLVSELAQSATPRWGLAGVALAILAGLVIAASTGLLDIMTAALCAAMLMVVTRCCTGTQARQAIDWQVLIVIGAAFGIANAMEKTELASSIADAVLGGVGGLGISAALAGVYVLTVVFTAMMTNNAAAALVFPIAYQLAATYNYPFMPFAVCIAMGASAAFITPVGYQTNLMVMGPGGYSWGDFLRFGVPLTIIVGAMIVWLAPVMY